MILDDNADVGDLRSWIVHVDEYEGLSAADCAKAVALLRVPDTSRAGGA